MERSKYFIAIISLILFFSMQAHAQPYKKQIYSAYIKGDMERWREIIDRMHTKSAKTADFALELVNYQYGYIGWCLGTEKKDQASKYLKKARNNLKIVKTKADYASEYCSYKAAFYGFDIALNTYKAPVLGPKSADCANKAVAKDKTNPFGFIEKGNIEYYMPPIFGGSKKKAIKFYRAGLIQMEKYHNIKYNWNYLNLLAAMAQAYDTVKDYPNANLYYKKILKTEPEFLWVRDKLYPEFKEKTGLN